MVDGVAMGRKIYSNLKKAIQYIISIHIPIILIVFLPLVLGWLYPAVFTPVHVIFLELIMGPTCSVIYENEPIEGTTGLCLMYWYAILNHYSLAATSAVIFIALISSNMTLTLVNRSFYFSMLTTIRYRNNLIPMALLVTVALVVLIFLISPLRSFFSFATPPTQGLLVAIAIGFFSVIWFEGLKALKRRA
jgi:Ca2+-transporting ATPase